MSKICLFRMGLIEKSLLHQNAYLNRNSAVQKCACAGHSGLINSLRSSVYALTVPLILLFLFSNLSCNTTLQLAYINYHVTCRFIHEVLTFDVSVQVSTECRSIVTVRAFVWASTRMDCPHVRAHACLQHHLE